LYCDNLRSESRECQQTDDKAVERVALA